MKTTRTRWFRVQDLAGTEHDLEVSDSVHEMASGGMRRYGNYDFQSSIRRCRCGREHEIATIGLGDMDRALEFALRHHHLTVLRETDGET